MAAEDEATFGLIPTVSRGWAKKGSKPVATINHEHKFTNVFGTRSRKTFVFSFRKKKKQKDFVEHLEKLEERWKKVLLFVDGGPCHKGELVRNFLSEHKNFIIERFPPYTPELNPTEQCWKPARKILSNRLVKTLPAAKYHLRKTFANKESVPKMFNYL